MLPPTDVEESMLGIWALANMVAAHQAPLRLSTPLPAEQLRVCIVEMWKGKPLKIDVATAGPRTDIAVGYPAVMRVVDNPKPFWRFQIDDEGATRTISIGYNFGRSPAAAEKQLRKAAVACAPGATELPPA
jgi:hypothetical protein